MNIKMLMVIGCFVVGVLFLVWGGYAYLVQKTEEAARLEIAASHDNVAVGEPMPHQKIERSELEQQVWDSCKSRFSRNPRTTQESLYDCLHPVVERVEALEKEVAELRTRNGKNE